MFVHRPRPEDNENDLLEFQKQFLASGQQPSAKLIKCSPKADDEMNCRKTSNSGLDINKSSKLATSSNLSTQVSDDHGIEEEMDQYDTHITKVLSNIIKEKNVTKKPSFPSLRSVANPQAIPCGFKKGHVAKKLNKNSLFSQHFSKQNKPSFNTSNTENGSVESSSNLTFVSKDDLHQIFPSSRVLTGDGLKSTPVQSSDLVHSIHEENITKLSQMSSSDIILEQKRIKENLDTKVLNFLSKQKQKTLKDVKATSSIDSHIHYEMDVDVIEKQFPLENVQQIGMHMDKIEVEKINWTKNIPDSAIEKINFSNRFDFEGCLLSLEKSIKIPSYVGLHHHGSEPDLAGYTLQELISLARSQFLQQQVFALRVLAKVINKDKTGEFYTVLTQFVTPVLLEAGLAFILRWALDSHSNNCLQVGVEAMHALLQPNKIQQHYLSRHFFGYRGCEFPSFQPLPYTLDSTTKEKDHELASSDLIKGLIQMDIILRIRYILEVCRPDQATICKCLEILQRICQHSMESAVKVLDCPRLFRFVVDAYLPIVWPFDCSGNQQTRISWPFKQAVRLVCMVCQGGRHATSRLIHDYPRLRDFIVKTITYNHSQPIEELHLLKLETWRLWTIVVSYGFYFDICRDLWSTLMSALQESIGLMRENFKKLEELEMMMKLISTVVKAPSNSDELGAGFLNQDEVKGFCSIALTIGKQGIAQLFDVQFQKSQDTLFGVVSGCLNTFTACFERSLQIFDDAFLSDVLSIIQSLRPLIISSVLFLQTSESVFPFQIVSALPDLRLGTVSADAGQRILSALSRVDLMTSYFRCCEKVCRANRTFCVGFLSFFTEWCQADMNNLIMANMKTGFLHRTDQHCIYWLINLFMTCVVELPQSKAKFANYFHSLSLSCVACFGPGDEELAADLVCNVLFHPDLWRFINLILNVCTTLHPNKNIRKFSLRSRIKLHNVSSDVSNIQAGNRQHLVVDILPGLRSTFLFLISMNCKQLETSRNWAHQNQLQISSFLLPPDTGSLLPSDWPFLPIMYLYDSAVHRGEATDQSSVSLALTAIRSCLNFLLFLEVNRGEFWKRMNVTTKIIRLMCLYMAGSDVFLDDEVAVVMRLLFSTYCSGEQAEQIDFDRKVPGLTSFYDFYVSLLDQYESVSYGHHLFSAVILLPLAKTASSSLKLALWAEHTYALQIISLSEDQLLLPAQLYFTHTETEYDVIRAYVRALIGGKGRSLFLQKLAVHHVASYINDQIHPEKHRREVASLIQASGTKLQEIFNHH